MEFHYFGSPNWASGSPAVDGHGFTAEILRKDCSNKHAYQCFINYNSTDMHYQVSMFVVGLKKMGCHVLLQTVNTATLIQSVTANM